MGTIRVLLLLYGLYNFVMAVRTLLFELLPVFAILPFWAVADLVRWLSDRPRRLRERAERKAWEATIERDIREHEARFSAEDDGLSFLR